MVSLIGQSIDIAGHKTIVSLEPVVWKRLREIATERRETLSGLVGTINADRQHENLSSAIRLFVLRYYRDQIDLARMVA
jgi:predicted DNA-binding ribbon-helix-helix protein